MTAETSKKQRKISHLCFIIFTKFIFHLYSLQNEPAFLQLFYAIKQICPNRSHRRGRPGQDGPPRTAANPQKSSTSLVQDLCKLDLSPFTFLFHCFIYRIHNFRYVSEKRLNALFFNCLKFCIRMFTIILMRNPIPPIKQFFQNLF